MSAPLPPSVAAARSLVLGLVAHGVRDVVLAPGSRSAPLAYAVAAAAEAGLLTLHVRVDERTAAFLALGLARGAAIGTDGADGALGGAVAPAPVAVVTTSGTAVANLHPAVLEAHHTGVPLLLLTADRPHELRGTGASQTTDQVGLFGAAVRWAADVPAPAGRPGEDADLQALLARAVAAARGLRDGAPGPVHLDLAYRDPLHPAEPLDLRDAALPDVARVAPLVPGPAHDPLLPGDPARTVVVAGDGAGPLARALAEAQGWPLLAEPSSGATGGPNAVPAYRLVLGDAALAGQVQHAVVLGRPTLSRPVQRLLARPDVTVTVVAPGAAPWPDAARRAAAVLPGLALRWTSAPAPEPSAFLARWRAAGAAAEAVVARAAADGDVATPLAVARAVAGAAGPGDVLVVGSSNPVRDLDLVLGADAPPHVLANRGLAGIDGTVSTALGVALAAARDGRRTLALLGDLTFLHDVGGLLRGPGEPHADLRLVVVNDDGGSIFATLEHGALAGTTPCAAATFERVFGTPHGASLGPLCAGYGVDHQLVLDVPSLRHALAAPSHGVQVVEVRVGRADRAATTAALAAAVREAVAVLPG